MNYIYAGDNTGAFGNTFIKVNARIPEGHIVSKVEIRIGNLPIFTFKNPQFPLEINLNQAQTRALSSQTTCYMAAYDGEGRKATCQGCLKFVVRDEVV